MVRDRDAGKNSHLEAGGMVVWAMIAWGIIGFALAYALAYFANAPVRLATVTPLIGLGLGTCIGPYAALGTTRLARVLWMPCRILALLWFQG